MHRGIPLLVVLCIVNLLLATDATQKSVAQCPVENQIVSTLRQKHNVQIFKQPKITSETCAFEFRVHGTCCDDKDLRRVASEDKENVNKAVERTILEFTHFNGFLYKYTRVLKEIAFMPQATDSSTNLKNLMISRARNFIYKPEIRTLISTFEPYDDVEVQEFKTNTQKCWSKVVGARSSSLCFACSGRSHMFFKDGKANIPFNQCQALIKDCYQSLSMTIELLRQHKVLQELEEQTKDIDIEISDNKYNVQETQTIYNHILKSGLLNILDVYHPETSSAEDTAKLCGMFIKLRDTTFIETISQLFKTTEPWTVNFKLFPLSLKARSRTINSRIDDYDNGDDSKSKSASNWSV